MTRIAFPKDHGLRAENSTLLPPISMGEGRHFLRPTIGSRMLCDAKQQSKGSPFSSTTESGWLNCIRTEILESE